MQTTRIVLVAGRVKVPELPGHHDYNAGCALLARLLEQTPGVTATVVRGGWPTDEDVFHGACSILFYTAGGGRQPFLQQPERWAYLQQLAAEGVGLAMLHQAVDYPREHADAAASWLGGATVYGESKRGHWTMRHADFPQHPVTRGVTPFQGRDGWICEAHFHSGRGTLTPLLWARSTRRAEDIVGWTYDRPGGGRSFCFAGLHGHSSWALPGLRQLIVNGVLWSAGVEIPAAGAPCAADPQALIADLTPRGSLLDCGLALLGGPFRRLAERRAGALR